MGLFVEAKVEHPCWHVTPLKEPPTPGIGSYPPKKLDGMVHYRYPEA